MGRNFQMLEARRMFSGDGDLNTSFGDNGSLTLSDVNDAGRILEVLDDKSFLRVIGGGEGEATRVAKYTAAGQRDTTWWGDAQADLYQLAYDFDLASGRTATVFEGAVSYFDRNDTSNHTLDTSSLDFRVSSVGVQVDGSIVVSGVDEAGTIGPSLARFKPDGSLDERFGNGGVVRLPGKGLGSALLGVGPDNSIYARRTKGVGDNVISIFDARGTLLGTAQASDKIEQFAARPAGGFAIATNRQEGSAAVVTRSVFDRTGRQISTGLTSRDAVGDSESGDLRAADLFVDRLDRLTVAYAHGRVSRYNADGSLDTTFGDNGDAPIPTDFRAFVPLLGSDGAAYSGDRILVAFNPSTYADTVSITLKNKNLRITGQADPDAIKVSLRARDNRLIVRTGDVARSFSPEKIRTITIDLGSGADRVELGALPAGIAFNIDLGAGNDRIDGYTVTSNAIVHGGSGDDALIVGSGFDMLFGDEGNDLLDAGAGDDVLFGLAGNDYLVGNSGNDRLEAGAGNDTLDGSAGRDTLFGNGGRDALYGGKDNDFLYGGADIDDINGGSGSDSASESEDDAYRLIETYLA